MHQMKQQTTVLRVRSRRTDETVNLVNFRDEAPLSSSVLAVRAVVTPLHPQHGWESDCHNNQTLSYLL
jgi:hypothetical protein